MVKETQWYRKKQIFWWCEEDARIILHLQSSTQSMQHFLQSLLVLFLSCPIHSRHNLHTCVNTTTLTTENGVLFIVFGLPSRERVCQQTHQHSAAPQRHLKCNWKKHKQMLWCEAMPVRQQPSAREPVGMVPREAEWLLSPQLPSSPGAWQKQPGHHFSRLLRQL